MLFKIRIEKEVMKKFYFAAMLASGIVFISSCGNNEGGESNSTDSSATTIPAPGNSSATNPSMADTAFSKDYSDTLNMKKDSANRQ